MVLATTSSALIGSAKQNSKKLEHSQSQEEAAIVLQKHYRGYQARNKNDSSKNNPLDANARKLIKSVCNKWRGKSIYQVIMLDRAKKLQDVVYFSLQVHLYNQHAICDLNNTNHRPVVMENIMTTTSVNEFLGGKRCYSYKIPFQLNHLQDTMINPNNLTDENSIDETNWDSPLNRLPETRTAYRILKHSFAVRDQGVQVAINECVRLNDNNYNNSQVDRQQVYDKFEEKPIKQHVVDNRFSIKEKKESKPIAVNKPKTNKPLDRSNPVLELQSKGKQYQSIYQDEDNPPYNFQAMLKKTNYKRPSLVDRNIEYSSGLADRGVDVADKVTRAKDYGQPTRDSVKRSKDYKNELNQQLFKSTRTELLPGIMLEGASFDL